MFVCGFDLHLVADLQFINKTRLWLRNHPQVFKMGFVFKRSMVYNWSWLVMALQRIYIFKINLGIIVKQGIRHTSFCMALAQVPPVKQPHKNMEWSCIWLNVDKNTNVFICSQPNIKCCGIQDGHHHGKWVESRTLKFVLKYIYMYIYIRWTIPSQCAKCQAIKGSWAGHTSS